MANPPSVERSLFLGKLVKGWKICCSGNSTQGGVAFDIWALVGVFDLMGFEYIVQHNWLGGSCAGE